MTGINVLAYGVISHVGLGDECTKCGLGQDRHVLVCLVRPFEFSQR